MFDTTKTVTLDGVVQDFEWANPHSEIIVLITPPGAKAPERWRVELSSPANLSRQHWTPDILKPGDKVDIDIHPAQDGSKDGAFAGGRDVTTHTRLKGGQLSEVGCC